jgi:hypothetical protein
VLAGSANSARDKIFCPHCRAQAGGKKIFFLKLTDYPKQLLFLDNCLELQEDERQKGAGSV